jgi:hypothetical protein
MVTDTQEFLENETGRVLCFGDTLKKWRFLKFATNKSDKFPRVWVEASLDSDQAFRL